MKILYPDKISSITASEAATDYPPTNLADNYTTNLWKGTSATATPLITLSVAGDSDVVALFNTNATSVDILVKKSTGATVSNTHYTVDSDLPNIWAEYTSQVTTHTIEITFNGPSGAVTECGVIRAGKSNTFLDPQKGLHESLKDLSVIVDSRGSTYYKKRALIRMFSGQIDTIRDNDFYTFLYTIMKNTGRTPLAWKIVTEFTSQKWTIFAWIVTGFPSGVHSLFNVSTISFSLQEGI